MRRWANILTRYKEYFRNPVSSSYILNRQICGLGPTCFRVTRRQHIEFRCIYSLNQKQFTFFGGGSAVMGPNSGSCIPRQLLFIPNLLNIVYFETASYQIAQADLEFTLQPRQALNFWFFHLSLPSSWYYNATRPLCNFFFFCSVT